MAHLGRDRKQITMLETLYQANRGENTGLEITITSEPAVTVVSTSDMKDYLKVDYSTDDTFIGNLVTMATKKCEQFANLSCITQTVQATWATYGYEVPLPRGPVQSIASVARLWQNDSIALTKNTDYYELGQDFLTLNFGNIYPTAGPFTYRLKVIYDAGYGDAATDVPQQAIDAVKATVAWLYEHRGEVDLPVSIPGTAKALLASLPGAETIVI